MEINSSPPEQNGHHFVDNILMNEKCCILIWISLKFLPKDPINYILAMVQMMALCWSSEKPLSAPMLAQFTYAYMQDLGGGGGGGDELSPIQIWQRFKYDCNRIFVDLIAVCFYTFHNICALICKSFVTLLIRAKIFL